MNDPRNSNHFDDGTPKPLETGTNSPVGQPYPIYMSKFCEKRCTCPDNATLPNQLSINPFCSLHGHQPPEQEDSSITSSHTATGKDSLVFMPDNWECGCGKKGKHVHNPTPTPTKPKGWEVEFDEGLGDDISNDIMASHSEFCYKPCDCYTRYKDLKSFIASQIAIARMEGREEQAKVDLKAVEGTRDNGGKDCRPGKCVGMCWCDYHEGKARGWEAAFQSLHRVAPASPNEGEGK